ncbi:hypothetical protein HOD29_03960 [archaeon]|jgi:membrane protein YdbS with pleckstrin-like domain|nr:hypothetical protein [archaeon]
MVKKSVKKKISKKPSLKKKSLRILPSLFKFLIFFVVMLVLYFASGNEILKTLFGIGAIIGAAVSVTLLLIYLAMWIYRKTHSKK